MAGAGTNGARSIQFGTFEVDLRAGELRRNGSRVKLQEQPFQVLTVLLEQPGEVVSRDELQKRLWPADTFVDFDHSLNAAIRRLRDALGDSAENPRFVETVARRGYRFVAPVHGANGSAARTATIQPSSAEPAVAESAVRPTHRRVLVTLLILLVGAVIGAVIANWPHPSVQVDLRRLTANPEDHPVLGAAISPDGKYLAFADNTGFYLREIESGVVHPLWLPKGVNATPSAWYPDGIRLVVTGVEAPASQAGLWQVSIMGDSPRKLVDDGWQASVSPDGSQIAFVRGADLNEELWIMQADGERPRKLLGGLRSTIGAPAWSPDSRRLVFAQGVYEPSKFGMNIGIGILDLGDSGEKTLLPSDIRYPLLHAHADGLLFGPGVVWTRDNHLIYSLSEPRPNEGDSNLWMVALNSRAEIAGSPVRLTATPDDVGPLSATLDGSRIAYVKYSDNPDVYIAELNAEGTRLSTPQQLTLDERRDYPFGWTPDSKTVLLASDRDGPFHVFKQQINQSVPELLVGGNEAAMEPRLTPDGSGVLYVVWPKVGASTNKVRLMRVPLAGGPPRMLLEHSDMGNMQCARLPSTLCLFDARDTKQMSFFRFDPDTGKSEEIPALAVHDEPAYAYNWTLSPDGKILATAKYERTEKEPIVTFVSVDDGSKRAVTVKGWAGIKSIDFAADGRSLWAPGHTNTGKRAMLNIDLQGHTKTMLEDNEMTMGWAIAAPDGKHLALWKSRGTSNVWLLKHN